MSKIIYGLMSPIFLICSAVEVLAKDYQIAAVTALWAILAQLWAQEK